jgi:radical SAM superfamily enzyme YgiQ (UPF0313 family)
MSELVLTRPGFVDEAERHWSEVAPLGLGYLAGAARDAGISVAAVDGRLEGHTSLAETVAAIEAHRPLVVGISALTVEYPRAVKLAQMLKAGRDDLVVVLGGSHANAIPKQATAEGAAFDCVISGEGESAIVRIVEAARAGKSIDPFPGAYRLDSLGLVCGDGKATLGFEIAKLPFPAWDLFPRRSAYPLMSERGCPYKCVFCSRNMGQKMNYRPIDHVLEEIRWVDESFSPREIYFEDETFALRRDRTEELLERLVDYNADKHLSFKAQTRVDRITQPLIRQMRRAGFDYMELGVESGDDSILADAEKGTNVEQVMEAVRILKSEGMRVWTNFIIGLPGETTESVRRSIDLAVRLNPNRLSVAIITAYPGTPIYEWARKGEHGYRLLSEDWGRFDKYLSSSVELDTLSYRTMRRLQLQMYLETYLRNRRFREFGKLAWQHRTFFAALARRTFSGSAVAMDA